MLVRIFQQLVQKLFNPKQKNWYYKCNPYNSSLRENFPFHTTGRLLIARI